MSKGSRKLRSHVKGADRSHPSGGPVAGFGDAVDIETACFGINQINERTRRERSESKNARDEDRLRAKITLSPSLDAWLKKEMP